MWIGSLWGQRTLSKQLRTARHRRVMAVLVEVRTKARVTQRELAQRLSRAHSFVSRIEKGDRRLDVPEMIQWCEALGADPVDVMKRIMRRGDAD
ncbi:MAG: helix-turn-helix domain-containing protein [Bradyrhizobium sp.]